MSQPTSPTLFSTTVFSGPRRDWWSGNPDATGPTNGALGRTIFVWSCILLLFVWFGGLIHIESESVRLSWSEMSSIRLGTTGGHLIAAIGGKTLGVGPYASDPVAVARCIAAVLTVAGSVVLMRFLVLPLTWNRRAPTEVLNARRTGANIVCAHIMAAQVIWWVALATLIFAAAMILPESMLATLRTIGRVSLAVIVLPGPALLLLPQIDPLRSHGETGAIIRSRWVAALIQLLVSAVVIIALVLIGSTLSIAASPVR